MKIGQNPQNNQRISYGKKPRIGLNDIKEKFSPEIKGSEIQDLNISEQFETLQVYLNPTKMSTAADLLFKEASNPQQPQKNDEKYQLTNTLNLLIREKSTDDFLKRKNDSGNLFEFNQSNDNLQMKSSRYTERREGRKTVDAYNFYTKEELRESLVINRVGSCTKTPENVKVEGFNGHSSLKKLLKKTPDKAEDDEPNPENSYFNSNFFKKKSKKLFTNTNDSSILVKATMEEKMRKISSLEKKIKQESGKLQHYKSSEIKIDITKRTNKIIDNKIKILRESKMKIGEQKNFDYNKKKENMKGSRRESRNYDWGDNEEKIEEKGDKKSKEQFPEKNDFFIFHKKGISQEKNKIVRDKSKSTQKTEKNKLKELKIKKSDFEVKKYVKKFESKVEDSGTSSSYIENKKNKIDRSKSPVIVSTYALDTIKTIAEKSKKVSLRII